jgi:hypothetical protein
MTKVLVPFTDPDGAEAVLRRLLDEPRNGPFEVELLAIAEPVRLPNVHRFISREQGEASARATAACWMARLVPLLQDAHVPYRTRVVVGHVPAEIEAALHRGDVDRVALPASAPRWSSTTPPVTVIS